MKNQKTFWLTMIVVLFLIACQTKNTSTEIPKKSCLKSFEFIGPNLRDTVNRTDCNGRQGKWIIMEYAVLNKHNSAEKVKTEEGFYNNNKKEGYWKRFDKFGNLLDSSKYINGEKVELVVN
jgi:hypothetical protein